MIRLPGVARMAKRGRDGVVHEGSRATTARKAWRLGTWTGITLLSIAAAVIASYTETGTRRLALGEVATAANATGSPAAEMETRRLADAVRALAADRDRLAVRLSALERNLDDVTGSIQSRPGAERSGGPNPGASPLPPALVPGVPAQTARAPAAAAQATPPAQISNQTPVTAAPPRASALAVTADTAAAASTATRTEFGIDLGTAATVEGLRNLWTAIKGTQAPLLEGLRPVVAVRDGGKPGALELRLVAGPLANAGVAARLCAALADAGLTCALAVFDGQRLALN
jgi:hypothetical protein